jgi:hypothetical protein
VVPRTRPRSASAATKEITALIDGDAAPLSSMTMTDTVWLPGSAVRTPTTGPRHDVSKVPLPLRSQM